MNLFKKIFDKKIFQKGYMLVISFLCVISVSFAWFFNGALGNVDSVDFQAEKAPIVHFSGDGSTYVDSLTITRSQYDLFVPLSGNGTMISEDTINLWKPTVNDDTATVDFSSATRAVPDEYLTFDYYLDLLNVDNVYLGAGSTVEPDLTLSKTSIFGNFSTGYIAGAVRVGFYLVTTVNSVETEELKLVWIPNSSYELAVGADNSRTFNPTGTAETAYSYYDGTQIVNTDSKYVTALPAKLFEVTDPDANTSVHMRVRIWVEGTDREADSALSGGIFNVNLELVSKMEVQN